MNYCKLVFILLIISQVSHAGWLTNLKNRLQRTNRPSVTIKASNPPFDPGALLFASGFIKDRHQLILDRKQYARLNELVKQRCATLTKMAADLKGQVNAAGANLFLFDNLNQDMKKYVEDSKELKDILSEQYKIHCELFRKLSEARDLKQWPTYISPALEELPIFEKFLPEPFFKKQLCEVSG